MTHSEPPADALRRQAEQRLQGRAPVAELPASPATSQRLVHELQVHQIELALQNEELLDAQDQVSTELERYADFYDFAPTGFVSLQPDRSIVQINLTGASLLGQDRAHLIGSDFGFFVAQADLLTFHAFVAQVFATKCKQSCEITLAASPSDRRTVLKVDAALSANGQECRTVLTDITELQVTLARLQLAASVFAHADEGIFITDVVGTILEVNDTFTRITGYTRMEAIGQNPRFLQSGRQSPEFYKAMWQEIRSTGHWRGELWNCRKTGEHYAEMLTISAVPDARGATRNYVALFTDITAIKAHESQLVHMANFDALTGLPNRLLLRDRLHQAMGLCQRRHQSLAVVFLDLDNFKTINDRHGHEVGDALLIELAKRMGAALREGDTLARLGGDEFVALIVDLDETQDALPTVERLLHAASQVVPLPVESDLAGPVVNLDLQVSASLGVTFYPQDDVDGDVLVRHADQAMYAAKQDGRNRYRVFDLAQEALIHTHHAKLAEFRQALDRHEFVLHYQPKINLRSNAVTGAEALIRWQHPSLGLLAPAAFLPAMEDQPISAELGAWVIASALAQMAQWREEGFDLPISVNVSAYQLQKGDFSDRLQALLQAQPSVPPGQLELEVLETSALANIAQVSLLMRRAQSLLGVHFSIDDFGTGYSSLTYLRRLPAEVLKIDQSFVRGMLNDSGDRAIVKGVIGLSEAFGRQVIAEGVETAAHAAALLALGCNHGQGYGIARPMPAADLPPWLKRWQAKPTWLVAD